MATKLGDAFVEMSAKDTQLTRDLATAQGKVNKSTDAMSKKLSTIGKGMTIAGTVITGAFAMAIKTASKFEQSMANTASVAGATSEELKKLSDYAREMGEQSVFSASQAADAMYYLASAGMNTEEIMGALEGTLALAAATASDLAFTSESVAAALSQFGLNASEAGRVANVYAAAISDSQATMDKLSNSMSYVGPMAKSMGMSIEDVTGILMGLYNAGIDGSTAGTSLRMAFTKLLEAVENGSPILDELGVSLVDSTGKMKPFGQILDELGDAGLTAGQSIALFGQRAGPNMVALISQGTGAIQENTDAIMGTNKANEMATMQIDTFQGAMKLLRSAFEEFQITLVQDLMPALRPFIEKIIEIIKKVSDWIKVNPELAATITKVAAIIGGLALVGGPILMAIAAFHSISGVIAAFAAIATGPIGLVIAAVALLALAWKTDFGGIQEKVKSVIGFIKELFNGFIDFMGNIKDKISKIIDGIIKAIGKAKKALTEGVTIGPETEEGWAPGGASIGDAMAKAINAGASVPSHAVGISYVPRTGLALLHKGEAVIPANQNTTNNSTNTASINIQIMPGAINIITPKFSETDGQDMFRIIERQAKMRGLKLVRD